MAEPLGERIVSTWVRFATELRSQGFSVPANAARDVVRALDALGLASLADVRAAARACLVAGREDWSRFDAAFERFFAGAAHTDARAADPHVRTAPAVN